jgi:hypothetical protein
MASPLDVSPAIYVVAPEAESGAAAIGADAVVREVAKTGA